MVPVAQESTVEEAGLDQSSSTSAEISFEDLYADTVELEQALSANRNCSNYYCPARNGSRASQGRFGGIATTTCRSAGKGDCLQHDGISGCSKGTS